jgi:hypothetical protein
MAKGSDYERSVCYDLSRWWTGKPDQLVFWRSSNSGGGATVRHRKGISNKSHAGDITAIEPTALPFTRAITVEVKRGYNRKKGQRGDVHDLLDQTRQAPSLFEQWICQAIAAKERAESRYWMILHRRDQRKAMVYFPSLLYANLSVCGCWDGPLRPPFLSMTTRVRLPGGTQNISVVGMSWDRFLFSVDPNDIRRLVDVYLE